MYLEVPTKSRLTHHLVQQTPHRTPLDRWLALNCASQWSAPAPKADVSPCISPSHSLPQPHCQPPQGTSGPSQRCAVPAYPQLRPQAFPSKKLWQPTSLFPSRQRPAFSHTPHTSSYPSITSACCRSSTAAPIEPTPSTCACLRQFPADARVSHPRRHFCPADLSLVLLHLAALVLRFSRSPPSLASQSVSHHRTRNTPSQHRFLGDPKQSSTYRSINPIAL